MIKSYKVYIVLVVVLLLYIFSGFYIVTSGQSALVLRFGKVIDEETSSGIHYHLPYPFEQNIKVAVSKVQSISVQLDDQNTIYLTGDENLVFVKANINFDIKNLTNYFYNVEKVDLLMRDIAKMSISHQLSKLTIDDLMTKGKSLFRLILKEEIQKTLDSLNSGVRIISVELTKISPPAYVSSSFKEVSNAREKKQEIIKEAEGYANSKLPKARGKSSSILLQAESYSKQKVNKAESKTLSFNNMMKEYYRNPQIVKNQKYIETLKKILSKSQVSVDSNPSKTIYYIDKRK